MNSTELLACEPIPIIFMAMSGPAANVVANSGMLGALALVVAFKAGLFAWLMRGECRVVWSALAMIVANVVTTVFGMLVGVFMASAPITALIGGLAVVATTGIAGSSISQRLADTPYPAPNASAWGGLTGLALIASYVVGVFYQSADPDQSLAWYFGMKWGMLFLLVFVSLVMTMMWEAALTARMLPRRMASRAVHAAILANVWTFFFGFLAAAALALPERMRHPQWLYSPPGS